MRLPFASRADLEDELQAVRRRRDRIIGDVAPAKARELREWLDRHEHDLTEQLTESAAPESVSSQASSPSSPGPGGDPAGSGAAG